MKKTKVPMICEIHRMSIHYSKQKHRITTLVMCFFVLTLSGCSRENGSYNQVTAVDHALSQTSTSISADSALDASERGIIYSMLLDGKEQVVCLDVSDEEITLWDSASAGQIIAIAKYAQPMSGAADALQDCDFTDLDEDGNSDLTANFSFTDGTTANLTWFYAEGGFVYNEEFSVLPGDAPAGNAE